MIDEGGQQPQAGPTLGQRFRAGWEASLAEDPGATFDLLLKTLTVKPEALAEFQIDLLAVDLKDEIKRQLSEWLNPPAADPEAFTSNWERYWSQHPTKEKEAEAREAFFQLPFDVDGFRQTFFDGYEHYLLSKKVAEGFIANPATWIKEQRWKERPPLDPRRAAADKKRRDDAQRAIEARKQREDAIDFKVLKKLGDKPDPDEERILRAALGDPRLCFQPPAEPPRSSTDEGIAALQKTIRRSA